jgi:hypothetical protein
MIRLSSVLFLAATVVARAQTVATTAATDSTNRGNVATIPTPLYPPATATRAVRPPILDGKTDDPVWQQAQVIDRFLEFQPNEGAESRFKTEVRVAYDDRNLYILGRMYDPAPDSIVALLSRRDVRTESEWLKIVIDSYHDRRTAYQFIVNPVGVKRDYYVYGDNNEDDSWDGVWDVATAIDSLGWVAEFRIPLSQLRFANKAEHTFGLLIWRDIARTQQRLGWPLYRRGQSGYVSQGGDLGGIRGIPAARRIELMPYVVTSNHSREPKPGEFTRQQRVNAGADLKYGVTSNLTLDATINPDFGQVEADPAVLNLGTFETFQQERRPFFLEGTGIFNFDLNCNDGCSGLFYSRRIGRDPQLRGVYGDGDTPTNSTILGAAKLTGRVMNGINVGVLSALTQKELGRDNATVEPATHYFVSRLQKELNEGRTAFGAMLNSVNRATDEQSRDYLRKNALSAGLDFRHRMGAGRNYDVNGYVAGSRVDGTPKAIARTQQSSVHYFQKPDDYHFDSTRTSLVGASGKIGFAKVGGGVTRFDLNYTAASRGFEINDVGFLRRADSQGASAWMALQYNKPTNWYRVAFHNLNLFSNATMAGVTTQSGGNLNSHVQLLNTQWLHFGLGAGAFIPTFDDRAAFGGPAKRQSPYVFTWVGWDGDMRRRIMPSWYTQVGTGQEGHWNELSIDPSVRLNVASRYQLSFGAGFYRSKDYEQFYDRFGDFSSDTTHYVFANTKQTVSSLSTRLDVTMTPNLTLQVYARPFFAIVDYTDQRELTNPRAKTAEERYSIYGTGADPGGFRSVSFQSNSVLRWEYRPGSTLFLVWTQGRGNYDGGTLDPTFQFKHDYRYLFKQRPDNTLLIKASYWFNP